ncbi:MAG: PilN domain-containing protein [Phycisphaeraceae bacterium]
MDIDTINFLPRTYQQRRSERRRIWRHAALLVLLCACLGGWWTVQRDQTQTLRHDVLVYEAQANAAREQMKLVEAFRQEHDQLRQRVALWQRLGQPVSHGQVFATLASQLPNAVVLTRLDVRTQRSVTAAPTSAASDGRRRHTSAAVSNAASTPDRLALDFTGIAPDDLTLANLLDQLKEHPLFDGVKLHFSRRMEIHGVVGRQFRIEMAVPLDRDYETAPAEAEEGVVRAD